MMALTSAAKAGVLIAAFGLLVGCAAPRPDDGLSGLGNFGGFTPEFEMVIAKETAQTLTQVFAPSQTRLNLRQPTPDAFGVVLVSSLRDSGYAVSEYAGPRPALGTEKPDEMNRDQRADAGVELTYILDHPDPDLYRVTVHVANRTLSRAYTTTRGRLMPFGAWVLKD